MLTKQKARKQNVGSDELNSSLVREWLYDKVYNLTMIADFLRGTAVHSLTANDQISHASLKRRPTHRRNSSRF